jgi:hypothetical protein
LPKFVATKRPLPRRWSGRRKAGGLVAEVDIRIRPRGRLCAKLLVFRNPTALRRFWRDGLGKGDLGRGCCGAVNALSLTKVDPGTGRELEYVGDRRYFCVIGLSVGWLSMDVVCHEAVHAAYCYERRVRRNLFGAAAADFDEERIAYPAGFIAAAVNRFLHREGLYEP